MLYLSRIFSVLVFPNQNQNIVNRANVIFCFAYELFGVCVGFLFRFCETCDLHHNGDHFNRNRLFSEENCPFSESAVYLCDIFIYRRWPLSVGVHTHRYYTYNPYIRVTSGPIPKYLSVVSSVSLIRFRD